MHTKTHDEKPGQPTVQCMPRTGKEQEHKHSKHAAHTKAQRVCMGTHTKKPKKKNRKKHGIGRPPKKESEAKYRALPRDTQSPCKSTAQENIAKEGTKPCGRRPTLCAYPPARPPIGPHHWPNGSHTTSRQGSRMSPCSRYQTGPSCLCCLCWVVHATKCPRGVSRRAIANYSDERSGSLMGKFFAWVNFLLPN